MANVEHLNILKSGASEWKNWRAEHRSIVPDLGNADLRFMNLTFFDLARTNLRGANFFGADLSYAVLAYCDLRGAVFQNAKLYLTSLDYSDASGSQLAFATLRETGLHHTDLSGAWFGSTTLAGLNIARTNLDETRHVGKSSVGVDTLERTVVALRDNPGSLKQVCRFLRHCGVWDRLIDTIAFLAAGQGYYTAFVSYSRKDGAFVSRLHARLQQEGIRLWLDEHGLQPGDMWRAKIESAVATHEKVLVCCSESSLTSQWVIHEVGVTLAAERTSGTRKLIPLLLDASLKDRQPGRDADSDAAIEALYERQFLDFSTASESESAFEASVNTLLRTLTVPTNSEQDEPLVADHRQGTSGLIFAEIHAKISEGLDGLAGALRDGVLAKHEDSDPRTAAVRYHDLLLRYFHMLGKAGGRYSSDIAIADSFLALDASERESLRTAGGAHPSEDGPVETLYSALTPDEAARRYGEIIRRYEDAVVHSVRMSCAAQHAGPQSWPILNIATATKERVAWADEFLQLSTAERLVIENEALAAHAAECEFEVRQS